MMIRLTYRVVQKSINENEKNEGTLYEMRKLDRREYEDEEE